MRQFYQQFLTCWRPFWYGPPCEHGVFGTSYNEGIVLDCGACMKAVHEKIRREIAEEKAYQLRVAFGPYLRGLESRISALESGGQNGRG